ncbi:hypothetical protein Tco_0672580 [Tanacetum coccineum]|uniref:DUF8018 domain-containing protein n=1 Tax=Tanacetum coccineum TaxID=301880 RepID=A0ABQ5I017_9ASTR
MPPDRDRVNALVILDDEAYRNTFAVPPNLLVIAFELGKAFTWSWLFLLQQRKDALIPRLAASFSTSKALDCLFVKQSFKQRGWAVHFIDLTSLYLRLKRGAGRAVKAHLVDSERAASTYSYQNEKQQAELELKKRASIRERKAVAHLSPEEPTLKGCKQRKVLTLSPTLFSDDVPWAKGDTILFLSSIVPIRTSGLVRFVLLSTQFSVFVRDHVGRKVACLPSHPLEKLVARKKRRGSEAVYEALLLPLKRTTSILGAHGAVYEEWLFGPFRPVVRTSSFHVEDTGSIPVRDSQEGSLSLPDPSPGPSGSENWDSSFEIDVLLEEWPTTAGGESAETGTSVNRPESGRVPPATHVAPRGDEAGPSNQPPQGVPYPYHPEQVIGGDSVLSIERRLLSGQTTPSPLDIYLARIDAEDLFEAKVKILQRMAELDPTGDWERRGARALDNPRTATGEESLERRLSLFSDLDQGGRGSEAFVKLRGKVFRRETPPSEGSGT